MSGTLGKAISGAGAGLAEANMEAMKAEILAMHDQRLNEYENQRLAGIVQPFEASQNQQRIQAQKENVQADIASREKLSFADMAQRQPEIDAQIKQINAAVGLAGQNYQEGKIKLDQLKQVQGLRDQMLTETDPKRFEKLAETFSVMTGQDMTKATSSMYSLALYNPHKAPDQQVIMRSSMDDGMGGNSGSMPNINDPFKGGGAMTSETQAGYNRLMGLGGAPANGQDEAAFTNGFNGVRSGTQPTGSSTRPAPPPARGDDTAFQDGFHEARGTPNFRSTTPAPATAAAAAPAAGSLQPINVSSEGPFEKAASAVSNAAGAYKQSHYRPGVVTGSNGAKTTIQPGMTTTVNGKRLMFQTYIGDSPNGAVWRVIDQQGQMYTYTAALQ